MDTRRQTVIDLIAKKSGLDEIYCKNLEIGIYNWTISKCDEKKIVKNWKNPRFSSIYGEKARSVINNIDKTSYIGNDRLVQRIKEKEFEPHEVSFMKPENIFPEKWRDVVENYIKKTEHAYEKKVMAMTDQFKCHKCHKRECTYTEMQTRSADESCTIFVRCTNCGFSWRMG